MFWMSQSHAVQVDNDVLILLRKSRLEWSSHKREQGSRTTMRTNG